MDETFVNNLAKELRKVGTIHSIGEEWVSPTNEIPGGGVPYNGQTVTRAAYSALWSYVQDKGLVKTESEWQALSGDIPYYSSGDGSTTFRMPKISGLMHGVYAFGQTSELGELDATALATEIANVNNSKLSLSGGTMSGPVTSDNEMMLKSARNTNRSLICGATNWDKGAHLVLTGEGGSSSGNFELTSRNGSNSHTLNGKADGSLTWDGENIVTSAGGVYSSPIIAKQSTATSYTTICGGTGTGDGARAVLCSKGNSDTGQFKLYASDGTNSKALVGKPDGTLYWGGSSLIKKFVGPTSVSSASYTATNDGFLIGVRTSTADAVTMKGYSNGILVAYSYDHHASAPWVIVPYKAGDAVSITVSSSTNIKYYKMEIA